MADNTTITIKKESIWKYSTFILAAILIIGAIVFFNKGQLSPTLNVVNNPTQQVPSQQAPVAVSADDDAVLGDSKAPVTIIEFSDYECPFCGRHFTQTYPQLIKDYI